MIYFKPPTKQKKLPNFKNKSKFIGVFRKFR